MLNFIHLKYKLYPNDSTCPLLTQNAYFDLARGKYIDLSDSLTAKPRDLGYIAGFPFDAGVCRAFDGTLWSVIYQRRGTKGAIYRNKECIREINRSFDYAIGFDYPIALIELPNKRPGIIHCPVYSDLLEIEDAETGENFSHRTHKRKDFYHSILSASPDGKTIADHGWFWHPVEDFFYFKIADAIKNPSLLDREGLDWICDKISKTFPDFMPENAVFDINNNLWVSVSPYDGSGNSRLVRLDHPLETAIETVPLGKLCCGQDLAYSLYEHLKVIDLTSGKILREWPEMTCSRQRTSISLNETQPPHSFDQQSFSIAIQVGEDLHIIKPE